MRRKKRKYSQRRTTAVIKRSRPRRKRVLFVKRLGKRFSSKLYFIAGAILILSLGVGYFLFFTEQFLITEINIEATKNTEQEIRDYLDEVFNNKTFFVLQQNKTINFPTEDFKKNIFFEIPKIKKAEVHIQIPSKLNIRVEERKQEGIWCAYGGVETIPQCFFYDKEGVIYEDAPNSIRGSLIKNIRDGRVESAQLGSAVIDVELLQYINDLISVLELAYEHPNYIFIKNNDEIHVGFSAGWEAYFSRSHNLAEGVENLVLILEKEITTRVNELDYIDLRLGNKAFYKWQGGTE